MIISHRYRFIFIKTHKTAGTSIEVSLSPVCGPGDVFTPIVPPEPGHAPRNYRYWYGPAKYRNHMPAREIRRRLGAATFDSYFRFCVERHPLDKCLSHYSMLRNSPDHRRAGIRSLADYVARGEFPDDWDQYTINDEPAVNRVLRYENLEAELGEVMAGLGCPWPGFGTIRAKGGWRERDVTVDDFTPAQRDVIRRRFARSSALLGYAV